MTFIVEYPKNLISMKTTQPKKRGRPLGSKNKFKTNPFAKKYKGELDEFKKGYTYGVDLAEEDTADSAVYAWQTAQEVKSWKRGPISETVNLTYIFLSFIIGFSLCAVVMTPLVINSI